MTLTAPGKALRAVFESEETALMPFGSLPIHAAMAQHAGFGAFQLPGGMSASSQGIPGVVRRLPTDVKESGEATEKYLPQSAQRGYDNSAHVEEHD